MDRATSRIMYCSSDRDMTPVRQRIAFGARVSRECEAEMIPRQARRTLSDEENRPCPKEANHAIHAILDMCAGLRRALNVEERV